MPSHDHRPENLYDFIASGGSGDAHVAADSIYNAYSMLGYTNKVGGSQPHAHDLDGSTDSENGLPPFYAMSIIMRVS